MYKGSRQVTLPEPRVYGVLGTRVDDGSITEDS